ncbi:MAG: ADP-glyceromanno-heptose 6-epimerase [Thermodesulfobacteriota bacterium]|nr:ADP-glyceromanno-heptose 6-epimerase [Thermodesulfobacteriota bacterium]
MKYIVTGGAGFIGSAVVWQLNNAGIEDILVVDNLGTSDKWKNLVNRRYADYIHKDAFLEPFLNGRFGDVAAVIHMGACSSTTERDADYLMTNNYYYSRTIAEYALANNIRLINASSAATYGDGTAGFSDDPAALDRLAPLNMYGYSKHLFDLWARRTGALDRLASLKFFNVFGPNEYHKGDMCSVIYKSFFQVRDTGRIRLFKSYRDAYEDGGQMRDFVYVKDCVALIGWLLENREANGIMNVGTGTARTWNDLAASVFAAMDQPANIEYIDMPEHLRDRYQYFTEAETAKLSRLGSPMAFTQLEAAADDYVRNYLQQEDPYL